MIQTYCGDCLEELTRFQDSSIDCVISDPPYFIINENGSGFMNKEWDSIKFKDILDILWKSKKYVQSAINFLESMQVEANMVEVNIALKNANISPIVKIEESCVNVPFVEKNSNEVQPILKVNINSVQTLALTKPVVLDWLNVNVLNHTFAKEKNLEDVLYVVPISFIKAILTKNTVLINVLKNLISFECEVKTTQPILMEDLQINDVIAAMTGIVFEKKSINEINGHVKSVVSTAMLKRYNVITLSPIELQKIMDLIILSRFAFDVMDLSKNEILHKLIQLFFENIGIECKRVLKEGSFCVFMSGARQDISIDMLIGLKNAGFDIAFDPIEWVYASGFPKAQNIAKAIDRSLLYDWVMSNPDRKIKYKSLSTKEKLPYLKSFRKQWAKEAYGKEIHDSLYNPNLDGANRKHSSHAQFSCGGERKKVNDTINGMIPLEELISPEAIAMDGMYSYSPKPARELILIAQKPTTTKSNIEQALKFQNGGVWFDRCRIPTNIEELEKIHSKGYCTPTDSGIYGWNIKKKEQNESIQDIDLRGRFPANLLVSDHVLDNSTKKNIIKLIQGEEDGSDFSDKFSLDRWWSVYLKQIPQEIQQTFPFLYVPKPTKKEKNKGLDKFTSKKVKDGRQSEIDNAFQRGESERKNIHPTCKPIQLMTYLIELFTKPGDTICDPFLGSGTTLIAAQIARRHGIGIELNPEYLSIANQRIKEEKSQTTLD